MPDLSVRSAEPEWMDDPALPEATYRAALDDLAKVNGWTRARPPTLAFLARATKGWPKGRTLRLLDVGSGQGDMLRAIHRWATSRGLVPELTGIDLSPASAIAAEAATPREFGIHYLTGDVFKHVPATPPDFVVSSLTAHHMDDATLVRFLRWMEAMARVGWLVNDLHRHPLAYHGFGLLARVMRWHEMVRHDGMISVSRSFRRADWDRLIRAAKLDPSTVAVRWTLPFRLVVERIRG